MRPFDRQRILLGVTGGIASYKAAWLARLLTQACAEVGVVMTRATSDFIGAFSCEALTGRPVHRALIVPGHACLLSTTAPTKLVPSRSIRRWAQPPRRRNGEAAREIGYHVLDPDRGALAVGKGSGPGRMPEPETILAHYAPLLETPTMLEVRSVVVTLRPTREPLDPVRVLSNRFSGTMGVAIAAAARRRGANITFVANPLGPTRPHGLHVVPVGTTSRRRDAVGQALSSEDALHMTAAPDDFTGVAPAGVKIKKVETGDPRSEAHRTLVDQGLDLIVANDALKGGAGFAVDTNRVTIGHAGGREENLTRQSTTPAADEILRRVEVPLHGR